MSTVKKIDRVTVTTTPSCLLGEASVNAIKAAAESFNREVVIHVQVNENNTVRVTSTNKGSKIVNCTTRFGLKTLPGCCGVGLVHDMITDAFTNTERKIMLYVSVKVIDALIARSWSLGMFTQIEGDNLNAFLADEWEVPTTFFNKNSDNVVSGLVKKFNRDDEGREEEYDEDDD
jgi:hypothetical protein